MYIIQVAYANKELKADVVVDMATLTGAQGIATGVLRDVNEVIIYEYFHSWFLNIHKNCLGFNSLPYSLAFSWSWVRNLMNYCKKKS